jgi:short-subunit dehydrogenase
LARRKGHIANIGSMFGMIAFPYFTSHAASKFALRGLSDALRRELEEYSITVSYIAPRATRTPAQSQYIIFTISFPSHNHPPQDKRD